MTQTILISELGSKKGQTLFAAHLAIILAEKYRTALVDGKMQNQVLQDFVAKRYLLNMEKNIGLNIPQYLSYRKNLFEEISTQFDFIVVDTFQLQALDQADLFVLLLSNDAVGELIHRNSAFLNEIWNVKKKRASKGKSTFKFVVVPSENLNDDNNVLLKKNAQFVGFRVAPELQSNEAYLQGIRTGVTIVDKNLPFLEKSFGIEDFFARRNLKKVVEFILSDK